MRVIHVAPTDFGTAGLFGGGERYPLELARAMARDVPVELITFGAAPRRWIEDGGLRRRVLRANGFHRGHRAHPWSPALPAAVFDSDVIHTHHPRAVPSRIAALVGRAQGSAVFTTDHGLPGGDWGGLLPHLFHRYLLVSRASAAILGVPPPRVRVIHGGADPDRYAPDPEIRREGVLFVGRITPHKGVDRLVQALPPGASLTIAGTSGHDRGRVAREYPGLLHRLAAGKNVRVISPLPDDALPGLYRAARVHVLPSVFHTCYGDYEPTPELLGLVVLEAMASGTPVIASRLGGLPEIVQEGITGFLVPPGDIAGLRDRIAEVLGDDSLAARLGRNARALVLDRFTWSAVAERCLEEYTAVMRRRLPHLMAGIPRVEA